MAQDTEEDLADVGMDDIGNWTATTMDQLIY